MSASPDRIPLPPYPSAGPEPSIGGAPTRGRVPLTEGILVRLPGPRVAWVLAWSALPLIYAASSAAFDLAVGPGRVGAAPDFLTAGVYVYAIALSLWAVRKMAREATLVEHRLVALQEREIQHIGLRGSGRLLVAGPSGQGLGAFQELGNVLVPLTLTLVTAIASIAAGVRATGFWPAVLLWPLPLLVNLALMTALWTYLAVLIGLDRLGRQKLSLDDAFPADPLLGLRPVGSLAFTAFLIMVAGFIPILVVSFVSPVFLIIDLLLFVPGVILFFLSLYRLHQQMAATRRRHVQRARDLYGQAYGPVWASDHLEDWRRESDLLQAVGEIERRAVSIPTWPFSPGVAAWILGISTSLIVTMLGRLILSVLGL